MSHIREKSVAEVYFVIPWWKTAVWFPQMLDLLVNFPLILPKKRRKAITNS